MVAQARFHGLRSAPSIEPRTFSSSHGELALCLMVSVSGSRKLLKTGRRKNRLHTMYRVSRGFDGGTTIAAVVIADDSCESVT